MASSVADVLVVGAGPTGLTLAASLQAFGSAVRIVDRQLEQCGPLGTNDCLALNLYLINAEAYASQFPTPGVAEANVLPAVVGWSIDSCQNAALVTNALGMAFGQRNPPAGR